MTHVRFMAALAVMYMLLGAYDVALAIGEASRTRWVLGFAYVLLAAVAAERATHCVRCARTGKDY